MIERVTGAICLGNNSKLQPEDYQKQIKFLNGFLKKKMKYYNKKNYNKAILTTESLQTIKIELPLLQHEFNVNRLMNGL